MNQTISGHTTRLMTFKLLQNNSHGVQIMISDTVLFPISYQAPFFVRNLTCLNTIRVFNQLLGRKDGF